MDKEKENTGSGIFNCLSLAILIPVVSFVPGFFIYWILGMMGESFGFKLFELSGDFLKHVGVALNGLIIFGVIFVVLVILILPLGGWMNFSEKIVEKFNRMMGWD